MRKGIPNVSLSARHSSGVYRASFELIAQIFEFQVPIIRFNGKDLSQKGFNAFIFSLGGVSFFLKKTLIGLNLNINQIRNRQRFTTLAKVADFKGSHQQSFFPTGEFICTGGITAAIHLS